MRADVIREFPKISLEAARVNAGITQKDAAKALGISRQTLARYEKGKSTPDMAMGKKMERIYKFPMDFILLPMT